MNERLSAIVGRCDSGESKDQGSKCVLRSWLLFAAGLGVFLHVWQGLVFGQQNPASKPDEIDILTPSSSPKAPPPQNATRENATNFISYSIAQLQKIVPELHGLRVSQSQDELPALLNKVGDKSVDLYLKLPNLISEEEVVKSRNLSEFGRGLPSNITLAREKFSYLILARRGPDAVTLEEFRVDLQTGTMLQTDDPHHPGGSASPGFASIYDDLARASQRVSARETGAPLSQGFASMWLRFHPSNRSESTFRYLGEQKIDRHRALVLAFAQKPGSVRLPGEVRSGDTSIPVYYQGIAWVDAFDFRIVRLRSDLLAPLIDVGLTQLTSEVQFADTEAAGFASHLWLPSKVIVTSRVNGVTSHEKHSYSKYRSFQAHARIVLNP